MAVARTGPQQLSRFVFNDIEYFADLRLGEFRGVKDFSKRIVFDSPEGVRACDLAGIMTCPECRTRMIVCGFTRNGPMRCVQCGVKRWSARD